MKKKELIFYNCRKCPAYCCSYPRIIVNEADIVRLAKHHWIGVEAARKKYTKPGHEHFSRARTWKTRSA